ncbi:hypothetical protein ACIO02_37945 [Streptomyces sp. NPDC087568]|uniref:hypothetical protein n=1 Tax=Streptomyces sp. NPDC087568 TaxID=3365799 RepID=UPI003804D511
MSTRRQLGTGPGATRTTPPIAPAAPRLLPIERADVDEHQEHDDPGARKAGGPVPGRRKLGDREQ